MSLPVTPEPPTFQKKMEECWLTLPYELYAHIVSFMDPVTRRDLWAKDKRLPGPQRLVAPSLDLKFKNMFRYPYPLEFLATYTSYKNDEETVVELTWGYNTFTFGKSKRTKFVLVDGIVIWRDVENSMLVYRQTDDNTYYEHCNYSIPM